MGKKCCAYTHTAAILGIPKQNAPLQVGNFKAHSSWVTALAWADIPDTSTVTEEGSFLVLAVGASDGGVRLFGRRGSELAAAGGEDLTPVFPRHSAVVVQPNLAGVSVLSMGVDRLETGGFAGFVPCESNKNSIRYWDG